LQCAAAQYRRFRQPFYLIPQISCIMRHTGGIITTWPTPTSIRTPSSKLAMLSMWHILLIVAACVSGHILSHGYMMASRMDRHTFGPSGCVSRSWIIPVLPPCTQKTDQGFTSFKSTWIILENRWSQGEISGTKPTSQKMPEK